MIKKLILILTFLFVSFGKAGEIIIEGTGKADINGYTFNDNSSYKLYRSNGHWKSSTGDFGLHTCMGTVTSDKNGKNGFNVYCKNTSQKDDYFIMKIYRDSEYQESGAGIAKIVEASKSYSYLIGAKCSHAVTYLKSSDYFSMQKCKF
tara:strand:- start:881 stop:1324 length:444 start_codon:yes stop_codon:yes gene_type:complete